MDFGSEIEDDKGYLDEQKGEDEEKKEDDLNDEPGLEEEKEKTIWDDIDWSEDKQDEREKTIWDDIDWSEDKQDEREETIWDDIDWSEDKQDEREETIWDDIDWSEDKQDEREETIWDDIDWSEDKQDEREETIWDDIDWSEDKQDEREETIWDDIDWSEDKQGERDKNEKDKNDDQNEEYNTENYIENVESQSISTVLTSEIEEIEGNVEHQEQEEEIEIHPEEFQDDTEPIVNSDESEFIKDVEELAEHAREIKAEDEDNEPQAEKENAAYYAEQYYENLKEKEAINEQNSKEAQETEELRQEVAEELKGDQESNYKSDELEEEATIEGSKVITSTEEFEYLWGVRERLDREGKTDEEIEEIMHEAEEMYETLKNAEKLYEEQELEKLKLVDHEDEATEEDLKEDLDRAELVEQAVELEEKLAQQGESQEEIDARVEEVLEETIETAEFEEKLEKIIEEQELEKLKLVDHEDEATEEDLKEELDRVDLVEQAVELEEKLAQQGESQEEIDARVEEAIETTKFEEKLENIIEKEQESIVNKKLKKLDLEINERNSNENVENEENLEVLKPELDAIESESEDKKDFLEESTKLESEESDEEEDERFQELYRQETGRRPIYARKKTKGYNQWLEQRELRAEKIKSSKRESERKKKKEIEEEGWKTTLKQWIREASEEECNAELKSELKKALENYEEFESLTRKFLELYDKSQHEKLTEIEKNILKSLTEKLQELGPIQLELLANIRAFKDYFNNHLWELMNRFFFNRVRSKFFKHISQTILKLKELINPNEKLKLKKCQLIENFSCRSHQKGNHTRDINNNPCNPNIPNVFFKNNDVVSMDISKKQAKLSPTNWGKKKRKIWEAIHNYIVKNIIIINKTINECDILPSNDDRKFRKIITLIFNYLETNTNLVNIQNISGQKKKVSEFVYQYIVAIWLMSQKIPVERNIIKKMSELDYKTINQIADRIKVILHNAMTKKRIDPDLLQKILDEIQQEIHRYNLGLEPTSLNKISDRLGVNQSVISYWGKKKYPKEYAEIWGRGEDWFLSEEIRSLIIKRFNDEIEKYNNDQAPTSLNSIVKEFNVSYETVRKIVMKEFPKYYTLIWKVDNGLSTEYKELLYKRLDAEVGEQIPTSLCEIGRDLEISHDMVRYYAKKRYPNLFDDKWGKSQLTTQEIESIQDRFHEEIKRFEKYEEKTIMYDEFGQKFDITKNEIYRPNSITMIANDLNTSRDTISRIFIKTAPEKYKEIYAKHRLTEEQLKFIISDILCTKMPLTRIAEEYKVSSGTISRISLEKVQPNYDDYDHSERFPQDVFQQLGTATHSIIEYISTEHLLEYDIYKFSEIPEGKYKIDDLLPCIEVNKFYNKLIMANRERLSLWEEIGLDLDDNYEIVFEYTSYISKKQYQKKTKKYYRPERMLLIVGTRWYDKKYPKPIIHTRFKNVKIIRHDIFADLIGLSGHLREEFENAIELNYNYDLKEMIAFKNIITDKYTKLGFEEYKKYKKNKD